MIVAVAPHLHGLPLSVLDDAVKTVLANAEAIPLPHLALARDDVWVAGCVLTGEQHIEELAAAVADRWAPQVDEGSARRAIAATETRTGFPLTDTQRQVAIGLMASGRPLELVIGVAGSGKTTALDAVRTGFESAGYRVLGAATSGQAARKLGDGAGIDSRTVASLTWRLDHGAVALGNRDIVILDEGAMTSDLDIARLLGAVARSGAKLVVVGDDRQLGAIGPGGALTALCERHPDRTWTLTDNLRQADHKEAAALSYLRAGNVPTAVTWYAQSGRIHPVPDRRAAVLALARAWAADTAAGRESLLLAHRRDSVEALNDVARRLVNRAGCLTGPELVAPGGRCYRAGDQIVTLGPGPDGAWVTSQTAEVTAVDPDLARLTARTVDGRTLHFGPEDIGADRLAHGYAMTAHRAQGATVDTAHVLDDGGGRELAYVAMSRAREASHVYVTASTVQDAAARLAWSWDDQRRHQWALDQARAAQAVADLRDERGHLIAGIRPDVSAQLAGARAELTLSEANISGPLDCSGTLMARISELEAAAAARREFLERHPEIVDRIGEIDHAIRQQTKVLRRMTGAQSAVSQTGAAGHETPGWEPSQHQGIAL